jgi:hypothetical protein
MFIKPTRSGGHTYLQLAESYRDEHGKTTHHRDTGAP